MVRALVFNFFYVIDDAVLKALTAIIINLITGTIYTKYEAQKLGAIK